MTQTIGILGGSFDPVHNGHVVLAVEAVERLALDSLLVVPARQSPHKTAFPSAPPETRLEMLRLAFAGLASIVVDDLELRRPPPSFTADTVAELERRRPDARFVLLMGKDALVDFPRWRNVDQIARTCRVAVFGREGPEGDAVAAVRRAVPEIRIEPLATPAIEISSTRVRERARAGLPLSGFVPERVRELILDRGLYR